MVDNLAPEAAARRQVVTTTTIHRLIFIYVLERPRVSHTSVAFVPLPTQLQVSYLPEQKAMVPVNSEQRE
jgi:hypothetical protein